MTRCRRWCISDRKTLLDRLASVTV